MPTREKKQKTRNKEQGTRYSFRGKKTKEERIALPSEGGLVTGQA
jgi:hypothetical protein